MYDRNFILIRGASTFVEQKANHHHHSCLSTVRLGLDDQMSLLNNRALFLMLAVLAPIFLSVCLGKDDLASSLSPQARVLYPGSPDFIEANTRWSAIDPPTYRLIVQAATEEDVQETVILAHLSRTQPMAHQLFPDPPR